MKSRSLFLLLLFLILAAGLAAQTPPAPAGDNRQGQEAAGQEAEEVVRVNTSLVALSARVLDRKGKNVSNLRREDFQIFEDGVAQTLAYFEPVEKPFTVALLLDTSGSTHFRLEDIRKAALAFIEQLRTDDRVLVITFNDRINVLAGPTSDREVLRKAVQLEPSESGTFLYDTLDHLIKRQLGGVQGRKAIVLFTDGVDHTSSLATYESSLRAIEASDVLVYPVQYDTFAEEAGLMVVGPNRTGGAPSMNIRHKRIYPPGFGAEHYKRANAYLREVAARSGTRFYHAESLKKVSEAFALIAQDLRFQYSLGYYPQNPAQAGQRRRISVRVSRDGLVVRTRAGYTVAPPK
jgi:Ca-activated chloride channel homolog